MNVLVFTGTRNGTTEIQFEGLEGFLAGHGSSFQTVCHGLAIGADYQFHKLARKYSYPIRGYPSDRPDQRADIPEDEFVELMPEKHPIERNHDMVDYAVLHSETRGLLVACPKRNFEEVRSGTWATVRYGRSNRMDTVFVWPSDGALEYRTPDDLNYYSRNRLV